MVQRPIADKDNCLLARGCSWLAWDRVVDPDMGSERLALHWLIASARICALRWIRHASESSARQEPIGGAITGSRPPVVQSESESAGRGGPGPDKHCQWETAPGAHASGFPTRISEHLDGMQGELGSVFPPEGRRLLLLVRRKQFLDHQSTWNGEQRAGCEIVCTYGGTSVNDLPVHIGRRKLVDSAHCTALEGARPWERSDGGPSAMRWARNRIVALRTGQGKESPGIAMLAVGSMPVRSAFIKREWKRTAYLVRRGVWGRIQGPSSSRLATHVWRSKGDGISLPGGSTCHRFSDASKAGRGVTLPTGRRMSTHRGQCPNKLRRTVGEPAEWESCGL
jgi:hypothetical protein